MIKDPAILRTSNDPRELCDTARLFAVSPDPADQQVLLQHLGSTEFLDKLDPAAAYQVFQPHQLRAAGIVKTLMDQTTPAPRETLIGLTQSTGFQSYELLIELLIRALSVDRPATPPTIAYWEKHLAPQSVYADNVVRAIFINRSKPALQLFERVINDPLQDEEYKYAWLRDMMLRQRNDPEVLAMCERMIIDKTVDPSWHEPILEAVFDFEPSWYQTCRKPKPPLRILAPTESKDIFERLGRHAVNTMTLVKPGLGLTIRLALREIGRSIDDENAGGEANVVV